MKKTSFRDFIHELEAEAHAEGKAAVAELRAFRDYFRLAREFAQARAAAGLSQAQLARKCGLHQSEVSDIERGEANPTFRTLQAVARGLNRRLALVPSRSSPSVSTNARTKSRRGTSRARG